MIIIDIYSDAELEYRTYTPLLVGELIGEEYRTLYEIHTNMDGALEIKSLSAFVEAGKTISEKLEVKQVSENCVLISRISE